MEHQQGCECRLNVQRRHNSKLLRRGILWSTTGIPAEMPGLSRYMPSVQGGDVQHQRAWASVEERVQTMPSGVREQLHGPNFPLRQLLSGFFSEEAWRYIL